MIQGKDMRRAFNGAGGNVQLGGQDVFYNTLSSTLNMYDKSNLGKLMNKNNWIRERMVIVSDGKRIVGDQLKERVTKIEEMMKSWYLYENGWFYNPASEQRENRKSKIIISFIYNFLKFFSGFEMNKIFLIYFDFFSGRWVTSYPCFSEF